jgi:hypothetical protein
MAPSALPHDTANKYEQFYSIVIEEIVSQWW